MKARITLLTLGVDDLERAVRFYRDGLGLKTEGIVGAQFEHGAVAFFDLQAGLKLALWPRKSLAHDAGLDVGQPSATDFSIGHNVSSRAEVQGVMEQARKAGAVIVKPAHDTFWGGYAGCFQDPDAHLWEVAWNPQWMAQEAATDLTLILGNLSPELREERWMFCQSPEMPGELTSPPLMTFREPEGLTLILQKAEAERLGLRSAGPYREIFLNVHTSLEAVGVTAAVSSALGAAGISCNIVAAFHHDHVFVHDADAERALVTLQSLSARSNSKPD